MDAREARREARRRAARMIDAHVLDVLGGAPGPDTPRIVEALEWLSAYLRPEPLSSVVPANLRPLVTPSGAEPDGAPAEWSARHDDSDRREDPLPG